MARQGGYKKAVEATVSKGLNENYDINRMKFATKLLPAGNVINRKQIDNSVNFENRWKITKLNAT